MWMSVLRRTDPAKWTRQAWKWAQGCMSRKFWECCLEEGAGTWALREGSGQWKAREGTFSA